MGPEHLNNWILNYVDGDPANDSVKGRMRATPHLDRCPYMQQVLAAWLDYRAEVADACAVGSRSG